MFKKVRITTILMQKHDPIYYALVPGRGEHSFLMGFGKLPLIFKELKEIYELVVSMLRDMKDMMKARKSR